MSITDNPEQLVVVISHSQDGAGGARRPLLHPVIKKDYRAHYCRDRGNLEPLTLQNNELRGRTA